MNEVRPFASTCLNNCFPFDIRILHTYEETGEQFGEVGASAK